MRKVIPILIVVILTAYGPLSMIDELEEKTIEFSGSNSNDVFDVLIGELETSGSMKLDLMSMS